MAYDPSADERVIAVRDWAERTGWTSWTEDLTDWEISDNVKGTRGPEGAIKKFCRMVGIEWSETVPETTRPLAGTRGKSLSQIDDADTLIVVLEERGIELKACGTCWMMLTPTGACDCTVPDDAIQTKLHHAEKRLAI